MMTQKWRMEDDAEKQDIFDLFQRWEALKSRPCLIVYNRKRQKKKNNNVEAVEAFVLTPFFLQPFLHSGMHISWERQPWKSPIYIS